MRLARMRSAAVATDVKKPAVEFGVAVNHLFEYALPVNP